MYAKVRSLIPYFFEESPEEPLGCDVVVGIFEILFDSGFEVGEFSYVV